MSTSGVGPTKSAAMVFGPARSRPDCPSRRRPKRGGGERGQIRGEREGKKTEETDFGQSNFGHPDLARPILANPNFGESNFRSGVCHGPRKGPTFRACSSLSRSHFRSFCLSLGVFLWNFGGVEAPGPSNVHVWSSRVVVWGVCYLGQMPLRPTLIVTLASCHSGQCHFCQA